MTRVHLIAFVYILVVCATPLRLAVEKTADEIAGAKPSVVTIKSLSFAPKTLEVPIGGTVVWENTSRTKHTAISDDDGKTFDTGEIKPSETSQPVAFKKEGEFKYHCSVPPKAIAVPLCGKTSATMPLT